MHMRFQCSAYQTNDTFYVVVHQLRHAAGIDHQAPHVETQGYPERPAVDVHPGLGGLVRLLLAPL
jgi:hypothetical protein